MACYGVYVHNNRFSDVAQAHLQFSIQLIITLVSLIQRKLHAAMHYDYSFGLSIAQESNIYTEDSPSIKFISF